MNGEEEKSEDHEHELVQSEQVEMIIRKYDDNGHVVSKVVTVTTEYMQRLNVEHTGLYL